VAYNRIEIKTLVREPLPWNLLEVAVDVTPDNDRWESGIAWESDIAPAARHWDQFAEVPQEKDLSLDPEINGEWNTSVIYGVYRCPAPPDDADIDRVRRRLEVGTPAGVEAAFWSWAFDAATAIATGTPAEVVSQLGQALADSGLATVGIFHMPSRAAERYLGSNGFNPSSENGPRTNRGDKVAVGAGYPNVGNPATTSQWIIASGPVGYLLSDIEVIESPESVKTNNMRELLAERRVALQVDSVPLFKGLVEFTDEYVLEGGAP